MECDKQRLVFIFHCAEGMAFDHRVDGCVSEELVNCKCTKEHVASNAAAIEPITNGATAYGSEGQEAARQPHLYGVSKGSNTRGN